MHKVKKIEMLTLFLVGLLFALSLFFASGIRFYLVKGDSMTPCLFAGNVVMVDTHFSPFIGIKPGDLVVYKNNGNLVIKRTSFLYNKSYFFVGDNLPVSLDSRHYGLVEKQQIVGKVLLLQKD